MSRTRLSNKQLNSAAARPWSGPNKPYDLIKELCIALAVVAALTFALAIVFSSPDERSSTIAQWSRQMPVDFETTAVGELAGSSASGGYGPPYNHSADGQHVGPVYLQKWLGVSHPINTAQDFVYAPLATVPGHPTLHTAVAAYQAAPAKTQAGWTDAYTKALGTASAAKDGSVTLPAGGYGPVQAMMSGLLEQAQSGGLDGALLTSSQFFQTDYTKPLLFLADGGLLAARAEQQHLLGTQWGMTNETGSSPGQSWLWLYTAWYQIKPFSTSTNADALVFMVMGVLSLGLILIPFIPGLRDIPRLVPLYRLIWREHYRDLARASQAPAPVSPQAEP
ncbi:MAG: hypothetical protein ACR2ND_08235 [Solirubrobacteraceae bacterium]